MPSPFPGMDPYLEEPSLWPDFYVGLLVAIRSALNEKLPESYVARADRHVLDHEPDADKRFMPNKPALERQGNRFIKIMDLESRSTVTVVEGITHAYKELQRVRGSCIAKRNEYLATGTNLVEIDLLRFGKRLAEVEPVLPVADYFVTVVRAADSSHARIWPSSVRTPLPSIFVPLKAADADVVISLQACFVQAFGQGRYERELDYTKPPEPPLQEPDATWARKLLAKRLKDSPKG